MAAVALGHGLLAWLLPGAPWGERPAAAREAAHLVPVLLVHQPRRPSAPPPRRATAARNILEAPKPLPTVAGLAITASPGVPAAEAASETAASASQVASGLDPGATARALRQAALAPSLAYQARVRDSHAPATLDERLQAGVKRAGRRDCLNTNVNPGAQGDSTLKYSPIPVTGLLVAPFLAADALTGKCGL